MDDLKYSLNTLWAANITLECGGVAVVWRMPHDKV